MKNSFVLHLGFKIETKHVNKHIIIWFQNNLKFHIPSKFETFNCSHNSVVKVHITRLHAKPPSQPPKLFLITPPQPTKPGLNLEALSISSLIQPSKEGFQLILDYDRKFFKALFRWKEKIRGKKIREKIFLLFMFRWIENKKKENNKKVIFYYLIGYWYNRKEKIY